jgi:hypothetical protein
MPELLERLVEQLMAKGKNRSSAFAIATSQLQDAGNLKPGTQELTPQGKRRQAMGASGRAKRRAANATGGRPSDFIYNPRTNTATKGKR